MAASTCTPDAPTGPTDEVPPPSILTESLPAATVGENYGVELSAAGGDGSYEWSVVGGELPPGLALASGRLAGAPTEAGYFNFTLRVVSAGEDATANLSLTVVHPPTRILTSNLAPATVGEAYAAVLEAEGGDGTHVWSLAEGSLPPGISLTSATLAGRPTEAGEFSFVLVVTSAERADTAELTLTVDEPPTPTTLTLTPPSALLEALGDTVRLVATVEDQHGRAMKGLLVKWTSSDEGVVQVSGGLVTAIGNGVAQVTAAHGGLVTHMEARVDQRAHTLEIVGGNGQEGLVSRTLGDELAVRVTDAGGHPIPGTDVVWAVEAGEGGLDPTESVSDADGIARTRWMLGSDPGLQRASARVAALATVSFSAEAFTEKIAEGTVVVDSTKARLLSAPDEIASGTIRFDLAPDVETPFSPGDVIVGAQGLGFLARVVEVSRSGSIVTLKTEPAALAEAVEAGAFSVEVPLTGLSGVPAGAGGLVLGPPEVRYLAPGVSGGPTGVSLQGLDLCSALRLGSCPPDSELVLRGGAIEFEPTLSMDATISFFSIESFEVMAQGDLMFNVDLEMKASSTVSFSGEKSIAEFRRPFIAFIGGLPVPGAISVEFIAGFSAGADLAAEIGAGVTTSHALTLGARYADEMWDGIASRSHSVQVMPPGWSADANTQARIFIRPEFHVDFFGAVGPFIAAEPSVSAAGIVGTTDCRITVTGNLTSDVGVRAEILDWELAEFSGRVLESEWYDANIPLECAAGPPAEVRVSGDAQIGLGGSALGSPISVEVLDEGGRPVPGVTVDFTPEPVYAGTDEDAIFTPSTATTDDAGVATTTWTLSTVGEGNRATIRLPDHPHLESQVTACGQFPSRELGIFVEDVDAGSNRIVVNGADFHRPLVPFDFHWGDGTSTTGYFAQSHTYSEQAAWTVTVVAHYCDGTSASRSTTVDWTEGQGGAGG